MRELEQIRDELREIKQLLTTPQPRPDDLVDAAYIAARIGLAERTVRDGKAGTDEIPRVHLKNKNAKRPIVRFARSAADKWIRDKIAAAAMSQPRQRALRLLKRKSRRPAA